MRLIIRAIIISSTLLVLVVAVSVYLQQATEHLTKNDQPPVVDARLETAVKQWHRDLAGLNVKRGWNRLDHIKVATLGNNRKGCADILTKTVIVSEQQLAAGPYSTAGTLYHELGHYLFKLEHGDCAIMRTTAWTEEEYRENWSKFVAEYVELCTKREAEAKY